jgi:hypothetical protein
MKTQKQILCKHCHEPIFYYDGKWWHGNIIHGYDKCINMPADCYAEPEEVVKYQ